MTWLEEQEKEFVRRSKQEAFDLAYWKPPITILDRAGELLTHGRITVLEYIQIHHKPTEEEREKELIRICTTCSQP